MKILVIHNFYRQPGGEDTVLDLEVSMLRNAGHQVIKFERSNWESENFSIFEKLTLPIKMIWSNDSFRKLSEVVSIENPDIAHFHNTFFMMSPAVYYACRKHGIPIVQSLHNPRLMCPAATFFRNGNVCTKCKGKQFAWPGVIFGCYRNSYIKTAIVAAIASFHRFKGTWSREIQRYIVFSDFYRNMFIEAGFPEERIMLKRHFVDSDPGQSIEDKKGYALYIGRLDPEKGVPTLLNAWLDIDDISLKIRGDGQLLGKTGQFIEENKKSNIEIIDRLPRLELFELIKGAQFLIWPSEGYYETFGLVCIDAFACGIPVIASKIGVLAENIEDGVTGLHFTPGDADDLAAKVRWAVDHPEELRLMGANARRAYEEKYTPAINYPQLMAIYQAAIHESADENRR